MASAHLNTPSDHNPTSRISPPHLLAVQTSSTTLQFHLGLNNATPYALPPPLSTHQPLNPSLGLHARLQPHALLLPESESPCTTTSVRALTFTDTTPSMHDPEVRREGLLKRVVVGEGGVREVKVGTVMVGGRGEGGEGEGEKWVFVSVVWGSNGGRRRGGRRLCFAFPERGVERFERLGSGGEEEVEGAGSSLLDIDSTRTASFSVLFSSGDVPVLEFADVDVDKEEEDGEGGFDAQEKDEVDGEDEVEGEAEVEVEVEGEGEGEGEGMDGVEAGMEGEKSGEEDGEEEREVEGAAEVDGEVDGGARNEGDGDGEEEEEWRSVKRAMGRGSCLVRFYV